MEILMNHLRIMKRVSEIASLVPLYGLDAVVAIQETPGYLDVAATDGFILCRYRLPTDMGHQQCESAPFAISPVAARVIGFFVQQMLGKEAVKSARVEIADNLSIVCDDMQVSVKVIETSTTSRIIAKIDELIANTPPVRLKVSVKRVLKEIKPGRLSRPAPAALSIENDCASICYAGNKWSIRGKPLGATNNVTATVDLVYLMDAIRAAEEIDSTVIIGMTNSSLPIFIGDDKDVGTRFAEFIMPMQAPVQR